MAGVYSVYAELCFHSAGAVCVNFKFGPEPISIIAERPNTNATSQFSTSAQKK